MAAGVVGFDLRDSEPNGKFLGLTDMEGRIEAAKFTVRECLVPDFVLNAVMQWPGTVDGAIERANQYLEAGATVVTILRRMPSDDVLPPKEFLRMIHGIRGCAGVVLQMPGMDLPGGGIKAAELALTGIARIGYGNQWPHFIRNKFHRIVKLQFST